MAIGIVAMLVLGVGFGVVSGLTRDNGVEPLAHKINGGDLSVIECIQGQDAVCSAFASDAVGTHGRAYDIVVDYEYDDRSCVGGNDITFRLVGPPGSNPPQDIRTIHDDPPLPDDETGELSVTFTPPEAGTYYWDIYCCESGECSSHSRGTFVVD